MKTRKSLTELLLWIWQQVKWGDEQLILVYERFAHKVQRLTGYDCFALAKGHFICFCITTFTFDFLLKKGVSWAMGLYFFYAYCYVSINMEHKRSRKRILEAEVRSANPHKVGTFAFSMRLFSIFGVGLMFFILYIDVLLNLYNIVLFTLLGIVRQICFMNWAYFEACDPLPPCRGKIRQVLDSFAKNKITVVAEVEPRTHLAKP